MILFYPGPFLSQGAVGSGDRGYMIRGMGLTPNLVYQQTSNTAGYMLGTSQTKPYQYILENFRGDCRTNRKAWLLLSGACDTGMTWRVNKCWVDQDTNNSIYGFNLTDAYKGSLYVWNSHVYRGYANYINFPATSVSNRVELRKVYIPNTGDGTWRCYSCAATWNDVHDYDATAGTPADGYGMYYGDYLIKFGPS
jgi:hypothetical protein